jgi:hypothetical protein
MFVVVLIIAALKTAEYRANKKRRDQGLPPLTEEEYPVNVIDWTRRK